jgi:hypothetical protein
MENSKTIHLTVNPDSLSQVISVEAKPRCQHCHNFLFGLTFGPKQQIWPENYDNGLWLSGALERLQKGYRTIHNNYRKTSRKSEYLVATMAESRT